VSQQPGIQVELGYAVDLFKPARGGSSQDPVAVDNLDLLLHLSLNPLLGLRRTSIRVHVQSNRWGSVSSRVGALQGLSNLEAPREWRLYEAWIGHQFGSPRVSVLAGVYDVNAEFDVIPGAGDFLNSSFGFGPEYSLGGFAGPSTHPTTGLATRLRVEPFPTIYGLLGVSEGIPGDQGGDRYSLDDQEGVLVSIEAGYARPLSGASQISDPTLRTERRGPGAAGRPLLRGQKRLIGRGRRIESVRTKVSVGGWVYTRRLEAWAPEESLGRSWGLYLLGEQLLHQESDGTGELSGFARVGTAASGVHRLDLSLGGGLVYRGALPGRPDDVAGVGIAYARNGSPFLRAQRRVGNPIEQAETVLELTYRAEFGRLFLLQPDLQWVKDPGMDPGVADALVFGLRGHVLLEYPGRDPDL
jgi:porin